MTGNKDLIQELEVLGNSKIYPNGKKAIFDAINLINSLQAENERLQQETKHTNDLRLEIFENKSVWERLARAEAIKEFAERLKGIYRNIPTLWGTVAVKHIDNLVKEMAGEDK